MIDLKINSDSKVLIGVLKLLSDGCFHSGEELGVLLGVSRTAVWKTLKKLDHLGIDLVSVKGRGYRINGGIDLLDAGLIQHQRRRKEVDISVDVFTQLDSTNAYLLRHANPERLVCLAESQTAGRGRRGRSWVSPFGQNLYLSIGWGFEGGVAVLEGLSLAIGVAVIRALKHQGVSGLGLKWPNDIFYKNKKLGGILIEMTGDPAGYCLAVVGIGINVSMSDSYSGGIGQPWGNLADICADQSHRVITRNQLAAALLDELVPLLSLYHVQRFSSYRSDWESAAMFVNQSVVIHSGNHSQIGTMLGVDEAGALRLDVNGKEHVVHGGEVSLRLPDDS